MSKLSSWWNNLWAKIKSAFTWGKPKQEPTIPQAEPTTDTTKPLCEPDRGEECPKPFGLDIRLLCWSPEEQDRVFIGYPEGSLTLNGKMLTANDFVKNGKAYTFRSHHQRSINAPALTERTVECKPCHKVVWEARLA